MTIHKTGSIDFAIDDTKNLINNTIINIIDNNDIISIADSKIPDIDTLDDEDMDFSTDNFYKGLPSTTASSLTNTLPKPPTVVINNASNNAPNNNNNINKKMRKQKINNNNNIINNNNNSDTSIVMNNTRQQITSYAFVIQDSRNPTPIIDSHVTPSNNETVKDSQHSYNRKGKNVERPPLTPQDLRHQIPKATKPRLNSPPQSYATATWMVVLTPSDIRIDKLDLINTLMSSKPEFVDLDWTFYNGNANIMIRFNNRKLLLEAIDKALEQYPSLSFNVLNEEKSSRFKSSTPIY